jgi:hypothetical protein
VEVTYIEEYRDLVKTDFCNKLIEKFESDPKKCQGNLLSGKVDLSHKKCTEVHLYKDRWEEEDRLLSSIFTKAFSLYLQKYPSLNWILKAGPIYDIGFVIKKYSKEDRDFYSEHIDVGDDKGSNRFISSILYLNNIEKGGETVFPLHNKEIIPESGKVAMFPPFWTHPHKANIPISDDKYIVNTFLKFGRNSDVHSKI